jgi:hypothetical protein
MRWPWSNRSEILRLLEQVAKAEKRAELAELRLETERKSKDYLTLELASRVMTASRQYGIVERVEEKREARPQVEALTAFQEAEREQWANFAVAEGLEKEDGYAKWEAHQRGELLPYERMN